MSAPGNTIGGAGGGNFVANNGLGMQIRTGADNNVVRGNMFTSNGNSIRIDDASGNRIGGLGAGDGNTIQNGSTGIVVLTATAARNSILGNSISGHTFLGIDIDSDGITANDTNDVDTGPNGRQNFPVLTPASGGVQGTLNSAPNGNFLIQFFGNTTCDASGNGEGATLLGATSVATNASGNAVIPIFPAAVGQFVTATATDALENTSEFSACVQPQSAALANLALTKSDAPDPVVSGSPLTYTISVVNAGPNTATDVAITDTLPAGVTLVSAVPSQGSCAGTTVVVCSLGTLNIEQSASVTITVTPSTSGQITNTAFVAAAQNDPDPANNIATQTTTVQPAPGTLIVTTTADSGAGSLRAAMSGGQCQHRHARHDRLQHSGTDTHTIALSTFLPTIADPVIIDATTQPGYSGTPHIVLDGVNAGATSNGLLIGTAGAGSNTSAAWPSSASEPAGIQTTSVAQAWSSRAAVATRSSATTSAPTPTASSRVRTARTASSSTTARTT